MRNHSLTMVLAILFTFIVAAAASADGNFRGKVVAASDGGTLLIRHAGRHVSVQLAGVDAPELGQPFGDEARELMRQLRGSKVDVVVVGEGSARSVTARVSAEGEDLSLRLVEAGLAWPVPAGAAPEIEAAAKAARAARTGLWAGNEPTPPWSYRQARETSQPSG